MYVISCFVSRSPRMDAITYPTNPSVLHLHSDQDEGFTSFVVVDEFLHNMSESDLFYEAQALPFPVEVQIKAQTESKSITKPALNIKKQQLKEEQKFINDNKRSEAFILITMEM